MKMAWTSLFPTFCTIAICIRRVLALLLASTPYAVVVLVLALVVLMVSHSRSTTLITIDSDFDGLHTTTSGRGTRTVRLLVVHGIGRHCVGYAHDLGEGLAHALGLQTDTRSFHQIGQALDKARRSHRRERLADIERIRGYPLSDKEKEERELWPFWPLINEHCKTIKTPEHTDITADLNGFENAQRATCKTIHERHTQDGMNCQELKLYFKSPTEESDPSKAPSFTLGYIRTRDYFGENTTVPALRVYELTWDPATRWAKDYYFSHDKYFASKRELANEFLKSAIVNDSISDAVLYLGVYQPLIQYTILEGLCKLTAEEQDPQRFHFNCLRDVASVSEHTFAQENELILVTHSLGTRVVFDVLGALGHDQFWEKLSSDLQARDALVRLDAEAIRRGNRLRDVFTRTLSKIIVLANQVPLLELAKIRNPLDFGFGAQARELGVGFNHFLQARKRLRADAASRPLQVLAFTDPNDLLSYNLKCWYHRHILRWREDIAARAEKYRMTTGGGVREYYEFLFKECAPAEPYWLQQYKALWQDEELIRIVDVSVNLRGLKLRPLAADPTAAHSRYFQVDEDLVYGLIACGGKVDGSLRHC